MASYGRPSLPFARPKTLQTLQTLQTLKTLQTLQTLKTLQTLNNRKTLPFASPQTLQHAPQGHTSMASYGRPRRRLPALKPSKLHLAAFGTDAAWIAAAISTGDMRIRRSWMSRGVSQYFILVASPQWHYEYSPISIIIPLLWLEYI